MKPWLVFLVGLCILQSTLTGQESRLAGLPAEQPTQLIPEPDYTKPLQVAPEPPEAEDPTTRFVFDFEPLGSLFSPKIKGFRTWEEDAWGVVQKEETIDTSYVYMPSVKFGVGLYTDHVDVDIALGWGSVANDWFGMYNELSFTPWVKLGQYVRVGPQFGMLQFHDAEWLHDSAIELEGGRGERIGLGMLIGNGRNFLSMSVSRVDFSYDVSPGIETSFAGPTEYWYADRNELYISGTRYSLGYYARF